MKTMGPPFRDNVFLLFIPLKMLHNTSFTLVKLQATARPYVQSIVCKYKNLGTAWILFKKEA